MPKDKTTRGVSIIQAAIDTRNEIERQIGIGHLLKRADRLGMEDPVARGRKRIPSRTPTPPKAKGKGADRAALARLQKEVVRLRKVAQREIAVAEIALVESERQAERACNAEGLASALQLRLNMATAHGANMENKAATLDTDCKSMQKHIDRLNEHISTLEAERTGGKGQG